MPPRTHNLQRFLRSIHRRLVLLRAAEAGAVGVAVASATALLLMPVLLWRGQDALGPALVMLGLGLSAGAAWGLARRPRLLDAAIEADNQLQLKDLLGTAWALYRRAEQAYDPFSAAVLASAEARCAQLSPAAVVLSRLGLRSWSGVGLSAALVLTVGLMYSTPDATSAQAVAHRPGTTAPDGREPSSRLLAADVSRPDLRRPPGRLMPGEDRTIGLGQPSGIEPGSAESPGDSGPGSADPHGTGGGAGWTRVSPGDSFALVPRGGTPSTTGGDGQSGGGIGPADSGDGAAQTGGTVSAAESPSRPVPLWRGADWPQVQKRAMEAVQRGAVPDAYRDLVRDYFQRD